MKHTKKIKVLAGLFVATVGLCMVTTAHADNRKVLDLSEWQGTFTTSQAKQLKASYQGVILRTQYGSTYKDKVFDRNAKTLEAVGMKYGVYSYSLYTDAADAKQEAKDLKARAPHAAFYANDAEQYTVTSGTYGSATRAWGAEMQSLTSKPVVLYSGNYFYGQHIGSKTNYDALWIAAYGSTPTHAYDMWQYTDRLYIPALGLSVDANKDLSAKMQGYFKGNAGKVSKYTYGGRKSGETVRVKKGAKFYGTTSTIADSVSAQNLTIKETKATYTGKSRQTVLVYNGGTVIGWVRAQDVTPYYHSKKVTKLRVTDKKGIYTYLNGKRQHHYKKGATLGVSHFTKNANGLFRAVHTGHKTTFTANKYSVKWVK